MADPTNYHDKFFRHSMYNVAVAQQFFQHFLPEQVRSGIDFDAIKLENSTYIDDTLKESISDLVFSCPYNNSQQRKGNQGNQGNEAKVVLLVEHQSTPERLMAFRVYHYLFNMLHSLLKQRPKRQAKNRLPAVYALVFYHGKQTPYPYSMKLTDCFDDPLNIMKSMFENPVHLVDVNQVQDDELKQQQLLGVVTGALKHSRDRDISRYLLMLMDELNSMDLSNDMTLKLVRTVLNYLLGVGNAANVNQFIKDGWRLPKPVRGEFMTIAETLRAMGEEDGLKKGRAEGIEKGIEKSREAIAINLLKDGAEPRFIERITGLELTVINGLKAKLAQ